MKGKVLFLLLACVSNVSAFLLGSPCWLKDGSLAQCVPVEKCPSAVSGNNHRRCGVKNKSQMICCPECTVNKNEDFLSSYLRALLECERVVQTLESTVSTTEEAEISSEITPTSSKVSPTWSETSSTWSKVSPTWRETSSTWSKVSPTWRETSSTWSKVSSTWSKVSPTWSKVTPTWSETSSTWRETSSTWSEIYSTWIKISSTLSKVSPTWSEISTTLSKVSPTWSEISTSMTEVTPIPPPVGTRAEAACRTFNENATPRIGAFVSNGEKATLTEFPHMALLGVPYNGNSRTFGQTKVGLNVSWSCGGSLISENFVTTAAHCVAFLEKSDPLVVRLGDLDWSTDEDGAEPQDFVMSEIILHPLYRTPATYHDIALIKLRSKVSMSVAVQPACLATSNDGLDSKKLIVTGWGTVENMASTSHLMKAEMLHVSSMAVCNSSYVFRTYPSRKFPRGVQPGQICAIDEVKNGDGCMGDSGGPLQEKIARPSSLFRVFGIISASRGCGVMHPSVYTDVAFYMDWIESHVWPV